MLYINKVLGFISHLVFARDDDVFVALRRAGLGDLHVFGLRGHAARGQQPVELGHAQRLAFFSARRALLWDSAAANTTSGNLIWKIRDRRWMRKMFDVEITMQKTYWSRISLCLSSPEASLEASAACSDKFIGVLGGKIIPGFEFTGSAIGLPKYMSLSHHS